MITLFPNTLMEILSQTLPDKLKIYILNDGNNKRTSLRTLSVTIYIAISEILGGYESIKFGDLFF
jgi:hypothetical protein